MWAHVHAGVLRAVGLVESGALMVLCVEYPCIVLRCQVLASLDVGMLVYWWRVKAYWCREG